MRLIDADALIEAMGEEPYVWTDSADEIAERNQWLTDLHVIESAPTIDAVSVVRCSECRWSRPRTLKGETGYRCVFYRVDKAETGYCDCGERKESE